MITTGCFPRWNNMAADPSVILLDRILRSLLARSLPVRNYGPQNEIVLPVGAWEKGATVAIRPPRAREPYYAQVEALGQKAMGVVVRSPVRRGIYAIERQSDGAGKWSTLVAVNGPAAESEASPLTDLKQRLPTDNVRFVAEGEPISLEGRSLIGHGFWKYLMVLALGALIVEMAMLGWSHLRQRGE
jgi:hypothetical protein